MKTVFTTEQAAHVWAQRTQEVGRGSNTSFSGARFYSYQTPIAEFHTTARGVFALVSSRSFSMTTNGRHLPAVRHALGYGSKESHKALGLAGVFFVPFTSVGGFPYLNRVDSLEELHAANLASMIAAARGTLATCLRAQSRPWTVYDPAEMVASIAEYADAFGGVKLWKRRDRNALTRELAATLEKITARFDRLDAKRNDPKEQAKLAHARATRAARFEAKAERERIAAVQKAAEQTARWLAGESTYNHARTDETGSAYFRVNGTELESSMGARVPIADAVRVFRFLKLCRENGRSWHANGSRLPVGSFQVSEIHADGSFVAGCHSVKWHAVEAAAALLGISDEVAADTTITRAEVLAGTSRN